MSGHAVTSITPWLGYSSESESSSEASSQLSKHPFLPFLAPAHLYRIINLAESICVWTLWGGSDSTWSSLFELLHWKRADFILPVIPVTNGPTENSPIIIIQRNSRRSCKAAGIGCITFIPNYCQWTTLLLFLCRHAATFPFSSSHHSLHLGYGKNERG